MAESSVVPLSLRDYQTSVVRAVNCSLEDGCSRVVVKMPTGSGKTAVAAQLIMNALAADRQVAFIVPFLSLIDQTTERFFSYGIDDLGVIQADHPLRRPSARVQICSAQTLIRREFPDADLVIVDEAHKQFADLNQWLLTKDWVVGLTATPWARGMAQVWDRLISDVTIDDLIKNKYLVPVKALVPDARPDLSGIKTRRYDWGRDYQQTQLSRRMCEPKLTGDIISTWRKHSDLKKTLIFAVDRAHARALQDEIESQGLSCGYVDAHTDRAERNRLSQLLQDGLINAIVNIATMTTGIDFDVRTIILARPTKSRMLYQQIVGRGLRPAPGKEFVLLLDHSSTTQELGLVNQIDANGHFLDDSEPRRFADRSKETELRTCGYCESLMPVRSLSCPICGWASERVQRSMAIDPQAGELVDYNGVDITDPTIFLFFCDLMTYQEQQQYKPGWGWHKFREKYKIEVPKHWMNQWHTTEVAPATLSWIKSRQIAYAKRRLA